MCLNEVPHQVVVIDRFHCIWLEQRSDYGSCEGKGIVSTVFAWRKSWQTLTLWTWGLGCLLVPAKIYSGEMILVVVCFTSCHVFRMRGLLFCGCIGTIFCKYSYTLSNAWVSKCRVRDIIVCNFKSDPTSYQKQTSKPSARWKRYYCEEVIAFFFNLCVTFTSMCSIVRNDFQSDSDHDGKICIWVKRRLPV